MSRGDSITNCRFKASPYSKANKGFNPSIRNNMHNYKIKIITLIFHYLRNFKSQCSNERKLDPTLVVFPS